MADKAVADLIRLKCARQNPTENLKFGYDLADGTRRKFHLKLWNIYNFFVTYANLDGYKPSETENLKLKTNNVLNLWVLARLNQTVKDVTEDLDKFDAFAASNSIDKFVDDLSLWYIRRSRDRVGPAADSESDKEAFYQTTYYVLHTTAKLLAPFTPFLSEIIYRNLTKDESVHLTNWPEIVTLSDKDNTMLSEVQKIREIVEKAHAIRKEKIISVKQSLTSFSTIEKPVSKNLEYLLKDEINVKKIIWNSKTNEFDTNITPELEEEAKARELMRKIQGERKNMGLDLTQKVDVKNDWIPRDAKLKGWIIRKAQVGSISEGEFNVKKI
ncbi:MAG: class I tRNA ligase family protein [Candidatus Woesebacteria bacterium]|nr:class I tRNA ligase family protein [Candidatus Woesebacteria bacterium]